MPVEAGGCFQASKECCVNERARNELGWRPRYDFVHVLDSLKARADPRSPLSRAVGIKGYYAGNFAEGPYPVE
jgi:UDP-glucose 4-epimerase